jgi:hypothetical protein
MSEYANRMLALIEQGAREAEVALVDLKALWEREDVATAANRAAILAAHEQGARDREEARLRHGGAPTVAPEPTPASEPEPEAAPRMSSLPVTPIAALDPENEAT